MVQIRLKENRPFEDVAMSQPSETVGKVRRV